MSIQNNKLMNLADGKVLYDDLRERQETINANKLDANQGAVNAGKFMVVNSSGTVVPTTVPFANEVSF